MLPCVNESPGKDQMSGRFRGYLPVVVDVETAGFNDQTDALLEIAAIVLELGPSGELQPGATISCHVEPFDGANLDPKALAFNGIDPYHPFREALPERAALDHIFKPVRAAVKAAGCKRAILVGHNAFFDLGFINAAVQRTGHKRNPFHPFSTFDTVTLAGMAYGQTVLAKTVIAAGLEWDDAQAHSAIYDTRKTAELFCKIVNEWQRYVPEKPWRMTETLR
jgi:ribonuclease T